MDMLARVIAAARLLLALTGSHDFDGRVACYWVPPAYVTHEVAACIVAVQYDGAGTEFMLVYADTAGRVHRTRTEPEW